MRVQVKDSGAWRNLVAFTTAEQVDVMQAAASLLRALQQPKTILRIAEGDTPLFFCRAPSFLWSET
jgi:hypothetical protein